MSNDTDEQSQPAPPPPRRRRRKAVDVQALRRDLLATCSRYLDEVPLQEMNGSLLKAIGEIVNSVGPEYSKHERNAAPSKALNGFVMPFETPDQQQPTGILPPPGMASPANGFPSVPEPSIKGDGGIKAPTRHDDYTGFCRPE